MEWLDDIWGGITDIFSGGSDSGGGSSWWSDFSNYWKSDSAWDKPDPTSKGGSYWDGFLGSVFSPETIWSGAKTLGKGLLDGSSGGSTNDAYANYLAGKNSNDQQQLQIMQQQFAEEMAFKEKQLQAEIEQAAAAGANAKEIAEMQVAAQKEIAAMQIAAQKAVARYGGMMDASNTRVDARLRGGQNTSNSLTQLAAIAQRPFLGG